MPRVETKNSLLGREEGENEGDRSHMQVVIMIVHDPQHRRADVKVNNMLTHDMGALIYTKCSVKAPTWKKLTPEMKEAMMTEI